MLRRAIQQHVSDMPFYVEGDVQSDNPDCSTLPTCMLYIPSNQISTTTLFAFATIGARASSRHYVVMQ